MSKTVNISEQEILEYIKISCQLPDLLEAIATHKILINTAQELEIKLEPQEIQQAADNLRLTNQLLKAEDTWEWLKKHRLTLDEFEELAQTNLLSSKLASHLFAHKVESVFYQDQLEYAGAVTYEVVLDDEDVALELFCALQEGEINFTDIARQYIQNPEIRRAYGYKGIQRRKDFRPEIAAAVFAATPPQVLKPIITSKGAHLIWVEEIIKPELNDELRSQILTDLFGAWLQEKIAQHEITTHYDLNMNIPA